MTVLFFHHLSPVTFPPALQTRLSPLSVIHPCFPRKRGYSPYCPYCAVNKVSVADRNASLRPPDTHRIPPDKQKPCPSVKVAACVTVARYPHNGKAFFPPSTQQAVRQSLFLPAFPPRLCGCSLHSPPTSPH
ncbi:hypothetical protein BW75_05115 [Escherichia coli O81:NM str. 02-3012]|nr:hypothetical protein BW75_05115 [Escherichia coli O81:NM str. 02-3012]